MPDNDETDERLTESSDDEYDDEALRAELLDLKERVASLQQRIAELERKI